MRSLVIIFEVVRFLHMILLLEQAFSQEFAFDKKAFKTLDEFRLDELRMC